MNKYEIHLLNAQNRIQRRQNLSARDDVTALEEAQKPGHTGPVEVWENTRLVARIGVHGEASAL